MKQVKILFFLIEKETTNPEYVNVLNKHIEISDRTAYLISRRLASKQYIGEKIEMSLYNIGKNIAKLCDMDLYTFTIIDIQDLPSKNVYNIDEYISEHKESLNGGI